MNKTLKSTLALVLAILMIATALPTFAFANETAEVEGDSSTPFSLLPIEEIHTELDLTMYLPGEIENMKVSEVLTKMVDSQTGNPVEINPAATTVWRNFKLPTGEMLFDSWRVTSMDEFADMTNYYYGERYSLELIIGSGKQLDTNNQRYLVEVEVTSEQDIFDFDIYRDGVKQDTFGKWLNYDESTGRSVLETQVNADHSIYGHGLRFGFTLNPIFSNVSIEVIEGEYDTAQEAIQAATLDSEKNITSKVMEQDWYVIDAGYELMTTVMASGDYFQYFGNHSTVIFYRDGQIVDSMNLDFEVTMLYFGLYWGDFYIQNSNGDKQNVTRDCYGRYNADGGAITWIFTLDPGYKADDNYYFYMDYYAGLTGQPSNTDITKVVVGHYGTLAAAASQLDIKQDLCLENFYQENNGYHANFSGAGIDFTVFVDGYVFRNTIQVLDGDLSQPHTEEQPPIIGSQDTYFRVNGFSDSDWDDIYTVENDYWSVLDTYYGYGYQTLLVNDDSVDLSKIKPTFWLGNQTEAYVGDKQESGVSMQDFSNGAVQYTAKAEDGSTVKNYWVSFVKKESGAKLFVNGPDKREVFFDSYFGDSHDIFIANVGDAELTGLTVTLDATNVKLDDYWTVGGSDNNTLAAFTEVRHSGTAYGELFNVAKIRLVPDGEGNIDGTLTISADGQTPRVINLTGFAGNPEIVTEALNGGVKFVPYSYLIATNNMHDWNKVTFSLSSGTLPQGVALLPNGEVYGVAKETGTFLIAVKADYSYPSFDDSIVWLTLEVEENTNANVDAQTDTGYEITTRIQDMTAARDQEFVIDGTFSEFVDLWLNGEKLVRGVDYTAVDGSTKITVKSQTFENKGSNGTNTIAGEYRDDNQDLKKGAQNYNKGSSTNPSRPSTNTGNGSATVTTYDVKFETNGGSAINTQTIKNGDKLTSVPATTRAGYIFDGWYKDAALTQPYDMNQTITGATTLYAKWIEVPVAPPETVISFTDISTGNWFYSDVEWAYNNKLMIGINNAQWKPNSPATLGMLITVLARLAEVDTDVYAGMSVPEVPEGQWYTVYAKWAITEGLLDGIEFNVDAQIAREDMAVIIARFLDFVGVSAVVTDNHIAFADEASISADAREVFQLLYKYGIFKGVGNNTMDPQRSTTRAELAALLHRIDIFIKENSNEEAE